jgi:hypothetical protein
MLQGLFAFEGFVWRGSFGGVRVEGFVSLGLAGRSHSPYVVHGENSTVGAMNNEIVCERSEEIIYYLTAS